VTAARNRFTELPIGSVSNYNAS